MIFVCISRSRFVCSIFLSYSNTGIWSLLSLKFASMSEKSSISSSSDSMSLILGRLLPCCMYLSLRLCIPVKYSSNKHEDELKVLFFCGSHKRYPTEEGSGPR